MLAFALLLIAPFAGGGDYGALSPSRIRATRYCKEANTLVEAGENEEAIQKYEKAIELWPDCAQAHCGLGLMFVQKGNWSQAAREFRASIRLQPGLMEAHLGLGMALTVQGDHKEAEIPFREAVKLKPDRADAWLSLGLLLMLEDRDDEAEEVCRKAIHLKPNHFSAHEMLGRIQEKQGDLDGAVEEYTQLPLLEPGNGRGFRFLGRAIRKQGDCEQAISLLTKAITLGEENAHASRGIAYFELGDFEKATDDFQTMVKAYPGNTDDSIWLYLARARANQEAQNVLLKHLESLEEGETPAPAVNLYLGRLAEDEYVRTATENDAQCIAYFRLGQHHLIQGDKGEAIGCFRKCVATGAKRVSVYYTAQVELERLQDGSGNTPRRP